MAADLGALREEAERLLVARHRSGAICSHPDRRRVDPYLGSFAALGLTGAGALLWDSTYSSAAYSHLSWYASAQDPSGFVPDFDVDGDRLVPTGDMDSTDGYAGMFLLASRVLVALTGLAGLPGAFTAGLRGAVRAIAATQDSDGLTWAKPSWHVKYLMDQVEALAGLESAALLAGHTGDRSLAGLAEEPLHRLRDGLDSLWDPASSSYTWAVHSDGTRVPLDRVEFYPGSVSQLWPVAFGLVDDDRSSLLVERFLSDHPHWMVPNRPVPGRIEYWPVVCWALARAGLPDAAHDGAVSILEYGRSRQHAWPYSSGTVGQLLCVLSGVDVSPSPGRLRLR